jgi:ubiquinone/menaquinone biosynthesis C-methylase UbiE
MKATGERFIPGQTGRIGLEHFNRYYFVIKQIELSDKVVLDIASGEGYGSDLLAQYSKFVYGVDISKEAIEHSVEKYRRQNLIFKQGSAASIPLDDNTVDIVVSFETIEHHDKHDEMISEIKRVMKKNGVCIISSPDKLYYSDIPNIKNEFHVRELYYDEFKNLISGYFKKSIFYNQKIFVGSIILLNENAHEYKKPIVIDKEGNSHEFNAVYNLAIATDNLDFTPNCQFVLYKESDSLVSEADIELIKQSVRSTKAYKLGDFLITPFRIVKRHLRRVQMKFLSYKKT